MKQPLFCFRFDVDTPLCVTTGVPSLLELARKKGVSFTFFINMGRAVSYRYLVSRGKRRQEGIVSKLGSLEKLGLVETLKTGFFNPPVGIAHRAVVRSIFNEGHEVGLHGGRNHATWQYAADTWTQQRITEEITWGKKSLEEIIGCSVMAFSSPGWNGGPTVNRILSKLGFQYSADLHGKDGACIQVCTDSRLLQIRTNLSGEPGGVGYIEWLTASGLSQEGALARTEEALADGQATTVLYDHPCYAGIQKLELLEELIDLVVRHGYKITTMNDILARDGQ